MRKVRKGKRKNGLDPDVSNESVIKVPRKPVKWINDLTGKHEGETCFLLGNGWSVYFYDTHKLKQHGVLIGCNESFKKHPLDYLVWQDARMTPICNEFKGTKVSAYRRQAIEKGQIEVNEQTYFFSTGRRNHPADLDKLEYGDSGTLAFQFAIHLGFARIFLVGCDCAVLKDENGDLHTNIFKDKIMRYVAHDQRRIESRNGWQTTKQLKKFAARFRHLYITFQSVAHIRRLGRWGIVEIPYVDIREFWTPLNPDWGKGA